MNRIAELEEELRKEKEKQRKLIEKEGKQYQKKLAEVIKLHKIDKEYKSICGPFQINEILIPGILKVVGRYFYCPADDNFESSNVEFKFLFKKGNPYFISYFKDMCGDYENIHTELENYLRFKHESLPKKWVSLCENIEDLCKSTNLDIENVYNYLYDLNEE